MLLSMLLSLSSLTTAYAADRPLGPCEAEARQQTAHYALMSVYGEHCRGAEIKTTSSSHSGDNYSYEFAVDCKVGIYTDHETFQLGSDGLCRYNGGE